MSFILDALKKSEERRQQGVSHQAVRKRVMTVSSASFSRGPLMLMLLVLAVPLSLAAGWWLRGAPAEAPEALTPVTMTPPLEVVAGAPAQNPAESVVPVVATPVPSPPAPRIKEPPVADAPVVTVAITPPEIPQAVSPPEPSQKLRPLYRDLSPTLRQQMPPLDLSLHFYIEGPQRRLVRINDRLLHEGDWAAEEVMVAEIVESGVVLDFAGRSFELRRSGR